MAVNVVYPRFVSIGGGAINELATVLAQLGVRRPLIVSDDFLLKQGLVGRVEAILRDAGITAGIFTDTVPDPTTVSIDVGVAHMKAGDYDSLIGLGGGSPQDSAKMMAILHAHGGRVRDYKAPVNVTRGGLPIIAVPTTAGTGSEVTRFAIITDSETDEKMLCAGPAFVPAAAVVDYELTLSKPLRLTADTGIDSRTRLHECVRWFGAWHEPTGRRLFPCLPWPQQRDVASPHHRILGIGRDESLCGLCKDHGSRSHGCLDRSRRRRPVERIASPERRPASAVAARLWHLPGRMVRQH